MADLIAFGGAGVRTAVSMAPHATVPVGQNARTSPAVTDDDDESACPRATVSE
ncbi:hypothetical protein [Catenuloplanes nepalensis]|uniref:hypothetical protein n=1 Tax=Catenuloplanes nepalensis TaxID=587533 RepID=UPI0027D789B7|nr:hypothetical protein [Catenuloplanes nepalensis]